VNVRNTRPVPLVRAHMKLQVLSVRHNSHNHAITKGTKDSPFHQYSRQTAFGIKELNYRDPEKVQQYALFQE
jgi:hypothetical protein